MNKKTIWLIASILSLIIIIIIVRHFAYSDTLSADQAEKLAESHMPANIILNEPKPETEKINFPAPDDAVTMILAANNAIYYYKGVFAKRLIKTDFKSVDKLIKRTISETKPANLFFIIKSDEGSSFENSIDLLDILTTEKVPAGHYAEADILTEEKEAIKNHKEQ